MKRVESYLHTLEKAITPTRITIDLKIGPEAVKASLDYLQEEGKLNSMSSGRSRLVMIKQKMEDKD